MVGRAAVVWLIGSLSAWAEPPGSVAAEAEVLDAVIAQHCDADVLFLGEDSSHGSGAAMAFKSALVPRLVTECAYDTLVFESGLYEFLALPAAPSKAELADAIGGLWSTTAELDPLLDDLVEAMAKGSVSVHGMDPQLGNATQGWTQQQLAASVIGGLSESRQRECQFELERLLRWQYDGASPYDEATEQRLTACADDILAAAGLAATAPLSATATPVEVAQQRLADGLQLARADGGPKGLRAQRMAEHLHWLLTREPGAQRRLLVWTSNAHAALRPESTVAAQLAGSTARKISSVQFGAAGGSRQRLGSALQTVPQAAAESREAHLFAQTDAAMVYAPAQAPGSTAWVMFRSDRPPHFVHPRRPRNQGAARPPLH